MANQPLTWRNVDAQSSGGTLEGLALAGRLLGNSTSGLSDAIGNFGKAQTDLADNAAVQAASRFQNAGDLQQALASGALLQNLQGVDPSRVSAGTLGTIQGRVASLLNDATTQQNLTQKGIDNTRLNTQNANTDAASAAMGQYLHELDLGHKDAANQIWSNNADAFAKLTPDQQSNLITGGQKVTENGLDATGKQISNATNQFSLDTQKRNDRDQQASMKVMAALANDGDQAGALTDFNTNYAPNLSPGAAAIARAAIEQRFGTSFGGGAGAAPGAAGGTGAAASLSAALGGASASPGSPLPALAGAPLDAGVPGTANGGKYNVTYQYKPTDQPITTMTIGDLTKDGGLMDKMQQTQKDSPIGAYQINRPTLIDYAKKMNLPADTIFTGPQQEKIAEQIYNDRKGGDLTQTWAGLKGIQGANTPGAFKNLSWDQVKDQISQLEGTAKASNAFDLHNNVVSLQQDASDVVNKIQGKLTQNNVTGVQQALTAGAGQDGVDANHVATSLVASNPTFKGADVGNLTSQINKISEQTGMNATSAAALLSKSLTNAHGKFMVKVGDIVHGIPFLPFDSDHSAFTDNLSNNSSVDSDKLGAYIKEASGGKAIDQFNQNQHLQQTGVQLQGASQAVAQAADNLTRARALANTNPTFRAQQLPRYEADYQDKVRNLQMLRASAVSMGGLNFPTPDPGKS